MRAMKVSKPVIIGIIIVIALALVLSFAFGSSLLGGSTSTSEFNCNSLPTTGSAPGQITTSSNASTVNILIVESDPGNIYEGINGSAYHIQVPWPVINVHVGQKIVFHIINCASAEPHGFAIAHYFDSGAAIAPGHSYTLTITADQKGSFRVYCSIYCSIHALMQNGQLNVS